MDTEGEAEKVEQAMKHEQSIIGSRFRYAPPLAGFRF